MYDSCLRHFILWTFVILSTPLVQNDLGLGKRFRSSIQKDYHLSYLQTRINGLSSSKWWLTLRSHKLRYLSFVRWKIEVFIRELQNQHHWCNSPTQCISVAEFRVLLTFYAANWIYVSPKAGLNTKPALKQQSQQRSKLKNVKQEFYSE